MKAPNFELQDQNGKIHKLSDYKDRWLIVYFYPKDDTPGCTKEACTFRDASQDFKKLGAEIIGISKDTVASHKKFKEKHKLNFTLLADPEHKVIDAYDSWGVKHLWGREYMGTLRNTYLINPKGEIVKKYEKVNPLKSPAQILKDLESLK